jgi:hypothetical protein
MIVLALASALALQSAPAFSYRDINASTTREAASAARLLNRSVPCRTAELGRQTYTSCAASADQIRAGIGGEPIFDLALGFDSLGLVSFTMITFPASSEAISASLTAKFGAPCETKANTLQNGFGAQVPQIVTTWCLSDGRLTFESVWPTNMQRAQLQFIAARFAGSERSAPLVDF